MVDIDTIDTRFMILADMTGQSMLGLAELMTVITKVSSHGREMSPLHVGFHCCEIISSFATNVANITRPPWTRVFYIFG